jgi:DNA invertase Pin-like site-specific DNA recombinase
MKKAVCYIRVSGKGQIEGTGLSRQRELCGRYAEKYHYYITETYSEEGISGTLDSEDRPAFTKMIEDLLTDGVRDIIVEGLDRLARTLQVQETLLCFLAAKGLNLHVARTEDCVTQSMQADPMKKALVQIQGVFSELEKSLLVTKLRKAREKIRAEKGRCEGVAAYGEEDLEEALVVTQILEFRKDGFGYHALAQKLNRAGVTTRHGKKWAATQIKRICDRATQQGRLVL